MAVQALVIGLGQFGMALARALEVHGVEVMAVDLNDDRVQHAATFVTEAAMADATDEDQIQTLGADQRDLCICAIGEEAREASIIVTALLRQVGARRVVARATDALHERILWLVGAHEVVQPEQIYGERLAVRLAYGGVLDTLPLGQGLAITELATPAVFIGRRLAELRLPNRFQVTVVAIRRAGPKGEDLLLPTAETSLEPDDILVLVSAPGAAQNMVERL